MTLVSIITNALATIGRSTDAQSMDAWKQKFTIFANDGAKDLAHYLQLRRTDTITATDNQIDINDLPFDCEKVVSVKQNGSDLSFTRGNASNKINVGVNGDVEVEYRYLPKDMADDIDQPGIPEHLHHLIIPYVVFKEHMTADPNTQRRADMYWQDYDKGRRDAKKTYGEEDTYKIYNAGWF
jgi:hypothetical protein